MCKKRLYILSLWVATLFLLLSTVVSHHHHMGRICMVEQQCQQDGNVNDEHTEHQDQEKESDRGNCRVHQMHNFFTNAKVAKSVVKQIFNGGQLTVCLLLRYRFSFINSAAQIIVSWQRAACSLPSNCLPQMSRRGPPMLMLYL